MTEFDTPESEFGGRGLRIAILLHTTMLNVCGLNDSINQFINLSMRKGKSKVFPVHAMKAYNGRRGIA
jgi:hypothetical protein